MQPLHVIALAAAIGLPAASPAQRVVQVREHCNCDRDKKLRAQSDSVIAFRQGAVGFNPSQPDVESFEVKQRLWFVRKERQYQPMLLNKQTLCGRVVDERRFFKQPRFFTLGGSPEHDWNHFIIPNAQFALPLNDNRPQKTLKPCKKEPGRHTDCIEAEVTPDARMRDLLLISNTEFPIKTGRHICVYGPAIRDWGHDGKVEIHPSELLWWSDATTGDSQLHTLVVVQDASDRFASPSDFDPPPGPKTSWAGPPIAGEFRIAIVLDSARETAITVTQVAHYGTRSVDVGSPATTVLQFHGRRVATLQKAVLDPRTVLAEFDEVRADQDGRLRGYLRVKVEVGRNGDLGSGGYAAVRVYVGSGSPNMLALHAAVKPAPINAPSLPVVSAVPGSVLPGVYGGKETLFATLSIRAKSNGSRIGARTVSGERLSDRSPIRGVNVAVGADSTLLHVQIPRWRIDAPDSLLLQTDAGPIRVEVPAVVLSGDVQAITAVLGPPADSLASEFSRLAGVEIPASIAKLLRRVTRYEFAVVPHYQALFSSGERPEGRSALADQADSAMRRRARRDPTVVGADWTVTIGNEVASVKRGTRISAMTGGVGLASVMDADHNPHLRLDLDYRSASMRAITVRADLHDGPRTGVGHYRVYGVVLPVDAGDAGAHRFLRSVASAFEANADTLQADINHYIRDRASRSDVATMSAYALFSLVRGYMDGVVVTPEEYAAIVHGVEAWRASPRPSQRPIP